MRSLLLACALAASAWAGGPITPQVGDPAPDFTGSWTNHPDTTLSKLAGRIVFIEFWRTW